MTHAFNMSSKFTFICFNKVDAVAIMVLANGVEIKLMNLHSNNAQWLFRFFLFLAIPTKERRKLAGRRRKFTSTTGV
jgi:hypothetical protein